MTRARTVLTDVRVVDGGTLSAPTSVVIDGSTIGTDPTGAETVDGRGGVLLPGLIEAHLHLTGDEDLVDLAAAGITTALDMACWPPERVDSFRGRTPDVRSAGVPAIGPGGPHAGMPGMPAEAVLTDPAEAGPFVARRVAEGSDYIKIVIDEDRLAPEVIDAVAAAARAHGKLTVAHASALDAYRRAVQAGVDVITHAPRDAVVDEETVRRIVDAGIVVSPTLTMMRAVTEQFAAPGDDYGYSRDSVAALHAAGVPILAGTDAFRAPMLPEPIRPGPSLHDELALLVEAGLTPAEAVEAATGAVARGFGLDDRGAITPGRRADLVLLDGDPTADIAATRAVRAVWCGGQRWAGAV